MLDFSKASCSLCRKDRLKEQPYSDGVCWETVCPTHNQVLIVLNRHAPQPTAEERRHIEEVAARRHPGKRFRGYMGSMTQHWHDHLI